MSQYEESGSGQDVFDEPQTDVGYEFDDADEMHRVRRLKQIHEARERFDRARVHARVKQNYNRQQMQELTRQLALDVLRQLEPLIRRTEIDLLDRAVTIPSQTRYPEDSEEPVRIPSQKVKLATLLDKEGVITVEQSVEALNPDQMTAQKTTQTFAITVDTRTATRIVRLCDDFLQEVMPADLLPQDDGDAGWTRDTE